MKFKSYFLTAIVYAFSAQLASAQPNEPSVVKPKVAAPQPAPPPQLPPMPLVTWEQLQQKIGGPTLITLHAKKMSGLDVIDELNRQSPIEIRVAQRALWQKREMENRVQTLTADYEAQPFWDVMLDIQKQMGLSVESFTPEKITLSPFALGDGLISRSGPCVFELSNGQFFRSVRYDRPADEPGEALNLLSKIYLDPKLRRLGEVVVKVDEATDDQGQSLLADQTRYRHSAGTLVRANLVLKPLATRGTKLRVLRGTYHGAVAFQSLQWEVPDVMKARGVEKIFDENGVRDGDDVRLELQEVRQIGDEYHVLLAWSQSGRDKQRRMAMSTGDYVSPSSNIYDDLRLVDASGHDLVRREFIGLSSGDEQTNIHTITVVFQPRQSSDENERTGVPAKLLLRYDFDWRELIVPFEFTDIPLP